MLKNFKINDYIGNDKKLVKELLESNKNIYLHKSDTGMGGTSVFLNNHSEMTIIISPLIGMIEGKSKTNVSQHNYFILKDNAKKTLGIKQSIDNVIIANKGVINCTAESLIKLCESQPKYKEYLKDFLIVIDESDYYLTADYRAENFYYLYKLIQDGYYKRVIYSSATPLDDYIDVPKCVEFDIYKVEYKEKKTKNITIYNNLNHSEILHRLRNNEKVVIFTNDVKIYKKFLKEDDTFGQFKYKIQCLASEKIGVKLNPSTEKKDEEFIYEGFELDANLYIVSTRYEIGFDMPIDAHIYIVSNYNNKTLHEAKNYNEIKQCYGRIRNKVLSCSLVIQESDDIKYTYKDNSNIKSLEDFKLFVESTNNLLLSHTFDFEILKRKLNDFTFNKNECESVKIKTKLGLIGSINNLIIENTDTLTKHLETILLNLQGDSIESNGLEFTLAIKYATALICKQTELVLNNTDEYERLTQQVYKFIDNNREILINKKAKYVIETAYYYYNHDKIFKNNDLTKLIYAYDMLQKLIDKKIIIRFEHAFTKSNIAKTTIQGITIHDTSLDFSIGEHKYINQFSEFTLSNIWDHLFDRDIHVIVNKLKLNAKETEKLCSRAKKITEELSKQTDYKSFIKAYKINKINKDTVIKRYRIYLLSRLVKNTTNNFTYFNISVDGDRIYNPETKVLSVLRSLTPFEDTLIDIESANPTSITYICGSTNNKDVYANIMKNKSITRNEAKKYFNTILNLSGLNQKQIDEFCTLCGYTHNEKIHITELLLNSKKGEVYRKMIRIEKLAIETIISQLKLEEKDYTRIHDAILITGPFELKNKEIEFGTTTIRLHKEF